MDRVVLLGGEFGGVHVHLKTQPKRILIRGRLYERIDDPDTDLPLNAYASVD